MTALQRVPVGNVNLHATTFEGAVEAVLDAAEAHIALPVRLSNAWCVVLAQDSAEYSNVLNGPGMTLPDGKPVAAIMKRQRPDLRIERVRGPSFFRAVLGASQRKNLSHFFIGGTPETLTAMLDKANLDYPELKVAGYWAPPFAPVDDETVSASLKRIQSTSPDIVWIGLGTPKQDFLSSRLASAAGLPCVGVGAAFDFMAGTVREAPRWVQTVGFEWLYRLLTEPRRLWKRYLLGNLRFISITRQP
ncbi:N-acetylglucosaminyldiphosphoundecaprenol N-acetyl-beta-D-mannosaminyltransferase [Microbacterium endophyticum]|uniref:N-acetylglucosaminyldiphosphoundecaprenol N-acetyl-beta-D-mannosaminyltransferase n=1 Tax=Microbacterium endophyticum TaxID=1526412 RepID=A0A7W4V2I3_9MICO|nr:WecB/TagA/CpsF family glycosyltransferase [Microbacterium endophyticum]MBB2975539.1 N-acetylglucosaminyldiphosphoundecaprenol N-acetyl-beta-D-mannosaminyltransferase [Microbacterium endophyticum]NIK35442.1 N-acetylglucosaminyldiphosphoundecaprenol N-acetyl-beta-D-mannosaminyltransferase [Microbacterium endophyticum]